MMNIPDNIIIINNINFLCLDLFLNLNFKAAIQVKNEINTISNKLYAKGSRYGIPDTGID